MMADVVFYYDMAETGYPFSQWLLDWDSRSPIPTEIKLKVGTKDVYNYRLRGVRSGSEESVFVIRPEDKLVSADRESGGCADSS